MIKAQGWYRDFLQRQMSGLTGHIEEAGFPFDTISWGLPDIETENDNPTWWVYEQVAYWLDGFLRCAILLEDAQSVERAKTIIEYVFSNADTDGYLGPKFLKTPDDGWNRWPHVVFFRSCMALYEYTKDTKILERISRHYLNSEADYTQKRNVLNVEIMAWLYGKTKNRKLLDMAEKSYREYNARCEDDLCDKVALSDKKPYAHGVSYNEYSKLGAILYAYTKKSEYLSASVAAYKKIDRHFMLIDGLHCSDEFMISNEVMRSHETCCVSDFTWSLYYMYEATKDSKYLDQAEKCIFNAGLGCVSEDFKSLQYFSCVNQVIADAFSNHNDFYKGSKWMSYRPNPGTECCPGNVNRFMPNYLWHALQEGNQEIILNLYADLEYKKEGVRISEKTKYPFENIVRLQIETQKDFTLRFRVPCWSNGLAFRLNGTRKEVNVHAGFAEVLITDSCSIEIEFFCDVVKHEENNCIWFSKGSLVYTHALATNVEIDEGELRSSTDFPAYNMYAAESWNFGLREDVVPRVTDEGNIVVEAYEIDWDLEHFDRIRRCVNLYENRYEEVEGKFIFTPKLPKNPRVVGKKVALQLVPYAYTRLRITAFPKIKKDEINKK